MMARINKITIPADEDVWLRYTHPLLVGVKKMLPTTMEIRVAVPQVDKNLFTSRSSYITCINPVFYILLRRPLLKHVYCCSILIARNWKQSKVLSMYELIKEILPLIK